MAGLHPITETAVARPAPAASGWARVVDRARTWSLPADWWMWPFMAVMVVRYFAVTPDDVFITLRYARNVVSGNGPVFNPGERVEGFTSPLHLVVAVGVYLLPGGWLALKMKVASFVFAVLCVRQTARLVDTMTEDRWARGIARLSIAGSWILACAAVNGLETSLAAWLVVSMTLRLVDGRSSTQWRSTAAVAIGCVLARPEAAVILAGWGIAAVIGSARRRDRAGLRWVVAAVCGLAAIEAVRVLYYADLLPNTFYAKRLPLRPAVTHGLAYLRYSFLRIDSPSPRLLGWWVVYGAGFALVVGGVAAAWRSRSDARIAVLLWAVISQFAFAVVSGGDWVDGARFVAPVIGPFTVAVALGWSAVIAGVGGRTRSPQVVRAIGAVGAFGVMAIAVYTHPVEARAESDVAFASTDVGILGLTSPEWAAAPRRFRCAPRGSTVAFTEMGYGPWVRDDLRFIDLRGLTDTTIARLPAPTAPADDPNRIGTRFTWGMNNANWNDGASPVVRYVLRREPALLVLDDEITTGPALRQYRRVSAPNERPARYLRSDLTCAR